MAPPRNVIRGGSSRRAGRGSRADEENRLLTQGEIDSMEYVNAGLGLPVLDPSTKIWFDQSISQKKGEVGALNCDDYIYKLIQKSFSAPKRNVVERLCITFATRKSMKANYELHLNRGRGQGLTTTHARLKKELHTGCRIKSKRDTLSGGIVRKLKEIVPSTRRIDFPVV